MKPEGVGVVGREDDGGGGGGGGEELSPFPPLLLPGPCEGVEEVGLRGGLDEATRVPVQG